MLSSLGTMATLIVWIVWLHLMYSDFRRRTQPRMLIHQTHGPGTGSNCLVVNLSQGIIHVLCVQAVIDEDGKEKKLTLGSDPHELRDVDAMQLEEALGQGPLDPGEFLRIGNFEEILQRLTGRDPDEDEALGPEALKGIHEVDIRVVAVFGASDKSVGASRRFRLITDDEDLRVQAVDLYTNQLYSRRNRLKAQQWLEECA